MGSHQQLLHWNKQRYCDERSTLSLLNCFRVLQRAYADRVLKEFPRRQKAEIARREEEARRGLKAEEERRAQLAAVKEVLCMLLPTREDQLYLVDHVHADLSGGASHIIQISRKRAHWFKHHCICSHYCELQVHTRFVFPFQINAVSVWRTTPTCYR